MGNNCTNIEQQFNVKYTISQVMDVINYLQQGFDNEYISKNVFMKNNDIELIRNKSVYKEITKDLDFSIKIQKDNSIIDENKTCKILKLRDRTFFNDLNKEQQEKVVDNYFKSKELVTHMNYFLKDINEDIDEKFPTSNIVITPNLHNGELHNVIFNGTISYEDAIAVAEAFIEASKAPIKMNKSKLFLLDYFKKRWFLTIKTEEEMNIKSFLFSPMSKTVIKQYINNKKKNKKCTMYLDEFDLKDIIELYECIKQVIFDALFLLYDSYNQNVCDFFPTREDIRNLLGEMNNSYIVE
jgi:hypothetical protein